jgi:hypothetical protein
MPISTRDLSNLADINTVERLSRSLAMLEAIVSPEWDYRYFSFNRRWDELKNERMASMRNGSGDEYFLVFSQVGAFLKGLDHESAMSPWGRDPSSVWPGVLDQIPPQFAAFLEEPAFSIADTTFCIWRAKEDEVWSSGSVNFSEGEDPDGSEGLLWMLDGNPDTYVEFASDYYEVNLDVEAVRKIYECRPLDWSTVSAINSTATMGSVLADASEIGYPVAEPA